MPVEWDANIMWASALVITGDFDEWCNGYVSMLVTILCESGRIRFYS